MKNLIEKSKDKIKERYELLEEFLNEKQRRLYVGAEAKIIGYGGISKVSKETGVSERVISEGMKELENNEITYEKSNENGRIRKKGGGRKKL